MYKSVEKKIKNIFSNIIKFDKYVKNYKALCLVDSIPCKAYVNWGINLASQGLCDEATSKFETSSNMAHQVPDGYLNLGITFAKKGEFEMAIRNFMKAIKIDNYCARAYTFWAATLVELGKYDEAEKLYEKSRTIDPRDYELYLNWGISLARAQRKEQAQKKFQKALSLNPQNISIAYFWGILLVEEHNFEEAIKKFSHILLFHPQNADALYYIAFCYYQLKEYEKASSFALKSLENFDGKVETYILLAEINKIFNDKVSCLKYYHFASNVNLQNLALYISWANSLYFFNELYEAKEKFMLALELDNRNEHALLGLALTYISLENNYEAKRVLCSLVEMKPEHAIGLYNLARIHFQEDSLDEAIGFYERAVAASNALKYIHFDLANCYTKKGDYEKAVEHHQKMADYNPKHLQNFINYANALFELGNYKEALRKIRSAYSLDKYSLSVNLSYGLIFEKLEKHSDAIEKFEFVLGQDEMNRIALYGLLHAQIELSKFEDGKKTLLKLESSYAMEQEFLYYKKLLHIKVAQQEPSIYNIEKAIESCKELQAHYPNMGNVDFNERIAYLEAMLKAL